MSPGGPNDSQGEAKDADRGVCSPCRGTGQLTSSLGGEAHQVRCPWCEGTGRFISDHDAQEAPAERQE